MHPTAVDRPSGRHEGLRRNLSAKNSLAVFGRLRPSENIDLNIFEVKEMIYEKR